MRRAALALALVAGCRAAPPPAPFEPAVGEEIVLCGRRFDIDAPVVLWSDPGGYDAYDTGARGGDLPPDADAQTGRRYTPGRVTRDARREVLVEPGSTDLAGLGEAVDLFVVHYDVCGASSRCFEVLQHRRGLSVHFLLDVDGTLYQTLDGRETAWHAAQANVRSLGVEIAQIGAYPPSERATIERWVERVPDGTRAKLPESLRATLREPDADLRLARDEAVTGVLHGRTLVQYDFTEAQYDTLAKLLAVLCRELPRLRPDAPRDAAGRVRTDALSDDELAAFSGLLGHSHVTARKIDPGPAFDWERLLADVRARIAASAAP